MVAPVCSVQVDLLIQFFATKGRANFYVETVIGLRNCRVHRIERPGTGYNGLGRAIPRDNEPIRYV
jgi:hypothetical protein